MMYPLQISYRDVSPSQALERLVREEAAKLEHFYNRIIGCHVLIEHAHSRGGAPFQVRIALSVPGEDIFVNKMPDMRSTLVGTEQERVHKSADVDAAYKDAALAVRSAFKKATRQLQGYVRRRAGEVKRHRTERVASISRLAEDSGFLLTPEGEEVYFARNSVIGEDFKNLEVGDRVSYTEEAGAEGTHAGTVQTFKD
ncbi:MAG: HPF/RaiA family ribosome-associated protein [Vulcanimicrobiaceae bacterium]